MYSFLVTNTLLQSLERFQSPIQLHQSFKDIVLFKIAMDAGGDSTKGIVSPVNVQEPQSLKYVKPRLGYTGKDYAENM